MILTLILRELLRLLRANLPLIVQITLIADKDDGHFLISMVAHLLQPFADWFECLSAGDVVDEENPDRLSVVSVRDCTVPFLAGRVPDLSSNKNVLDGHIVRGKFNSNCSMRLALKLIFCVSE